MVTIKRHTATAPPPPPPSPDVKSGTVPDLTDAPLPATVDGDLLEGAAEIARFLFGSEAKPVRARTAIRHGLPCWRIGNRYWARRSTILAWIRDQEIGTGFGRSR